MRKTRKELIRALYGEDVDLVPHTEDELHTKMSPLKFPRYNPSLVYGVPLKGGFSVSRPDPNTSYTPADIAEWVLSDTRTITRRQILRPTGEREIRIFISKLAHGPGNYLTLWSYRENIGDYLENPSNIEGSFETFEEITGVKILDALNWVRTLKHGISNGHFSPDDAFPLITWYEIMFYGIMTGDFEPLQDYMRTEIRRPGVVLMLRDEEDRRLLIQRDNKVDIASPGIWYPPTETIESESPYQTAVRCAQEELGIDVEPMLLKKEELATGTPAFIYDAQIPEGKDLVLHEGQNFDLFDINAIDGLGNPDNIRRKLKYLFSLN